MLRALTNYLLFFSLTGVFSLVKPQNPLASAVPENSKIVSVKIYPTVPLIEGDRAGQYLNFDLTIQNTSNHILDLSGVELSVNDEKGKLISRKFLNENGQAPSVALLGKTIFNPGEIVNIFNPFFQFPAEIPLTHLTFRFLFNYADKKVQTGVQPKRLPFDYDSYYSLTVSPTYYHPKTTLYLPLKGKMIVWDGHDYFAHHRRFPVGLPKQLRSGILANSNRYAYDFINIDEQGRMFKTDPFKKENWYVFGKAVYAPGAGVIVDAQDNIPDNEYQDKKIKYPDIPDTLDPLGMGNHLVIDHGDGEFSVILHMEKGTVKLKVGDRVTAGQQIGTVGFSGDAICPHVHYTVMNGPKEQVCEGVPSNFNNFWLIRGSKLTKVKKGRIDTGDLIMSN